MTNPYHMYVSSVSSLRTVLAVSLCELYTWGLVWYTRFSNQYDFYDFLS